MAADVYNAIWCIVFMKQCYAAICTVLYAFLYLHKKTRQATKGAIKHPIQE